MNVTRLLARIAILGAFTSLSLAASVSSKPGATELLQKLGDEFYLEQARFDPVTNATFTGDNQFDDQLNISISPAERTTHFAKLHQQQQQLKTIARSQLSDEDGLSYDALSALLQLNVEAEQFPDHLLPVSHMDSMPVTLANFGSGQAEQPLKSVADYDAYLKRLSRLPEWIDQSIINMQLGMKQGIVQSRYIVSATLEPLKGLTIALEKSPYYAPVKNMPASFSASDQERLKRQYTEMVTQHIIPSTKKLAEFVEKQYLPASRATDGYGTLPNGKQWYEHNVRMQTTTNLDPETIHTLGLNEVSRIHGELAKLAPKLGYSGDPKQLLTWIRTNPKFLTFKSESEILNAYRAINEKVKTQLPRLFGRLPKAPLDIRAEPELTRDVASDHYSLGSDDGSRPGVFWAVITDPAIYNSSTMGSLFLHEGQPGHHFQLSIQQEASLPIFRKRAQINAYAEGWGLYAETLGHEMGLYDDPVMYAGNLRLEMIRAVRLVVDTGLHAKGWTHDQAIAYMMDNAGLSQDQARNQIERYMAWPGQALGYKLGALKIQELRARARQQVGEKFSLAAFHDEVLREGPLPLSVLDAYINRWIARQKLH